MSSQSDDAGEDLDDGIDEVDGDDLAETETSLSAESPSSRIVIDSLSASALCSKVSSFIAQHNLPIGLLVAVIFGALVPEPGQWLATLPLPLTDISVFIIFVIQGLKLNTAELTDALSSVRSCAYGVVTILFITSLMALIAMAVPFSPTDFAVGFGLFAVMPTTISGGIVLTREADGNVPLSLLLTLFTNTAAIVTVPLLLPPLVLNRLSDPTSTITVNISSTSLILNLLIDILLPLLCGKLIRSYLPNSLYYIKKTDHFTRYLANICLMFLPFLQISQSHSIIISLSISAIFIVIFAGLIMHIIYLIWNFTITYLLYNILLLNISKHKSLVIMSSQKSVAIAVAVLSQLPIATERKGVVVVPLVVAHLIQTVMDSVVAAVWKSRTDMAHSRINGEEDTADIEMVKTHVDAETETAGDGDDNDADEETDDDADDVDVGDDIESDGENGEEADISNVDVDGENDATPMHIIIDPPINDRRIESFVQETTLS